MNSNDVKNIIKKIITFDVVKNQINSKEIYWHILIKISF